MVSTAPTLLNGYKSVENFYEATHDVREDKTVLEELQDFWKDGPGINRSPYRALMKIEEGEACREAVVMLSE